MKKNYTKAIVVSSLVLSIALLSSSQADAGIFDHLKSIAQKAAQAAGKVTTNKDVQAAVLNVGKHAVGALKNQS